MGLLRSGLILFFSLTAPQVQASNDLGNYLYCGVVELFQERMAENFPEGLGELIPNENDPFLQTYVADDNSWVTIENISRNHDLSKEDIFCIVEQGFEYE